jgi:glycosyltransferase involved in cell wall biosynthesis
VRKHMFPAAGDASLVRWGGTTGDASLVRGGGMTGDASLVRRGGMTGDASRVRGGSVTGDAASVRCGISIIIPTLNEEKVIGRTLKQFVPYRERFKLELIVSDDSSDDRTVEIAAELADKVVMSDDDERGRSRALNRGAREASHDIFVFLDADMIIDNKWGFFDEVYGVFAADSSIVGGMMDFYVYPGECTFADRLTHTFWNTVMRNVLKLGWGISTPGFQMGRRDAFGEVGGFDENLRLTQDVDYSLRLSRVGKIHYFRSARLLESPRRYRDEGYAVYAYRSTLRWLSILFRGRSHGEYKIAR